MKGSIVLKWVLGVIAIILLLKIILWVIVQPLIRNKVEQALNNNNSGYSFQIDKVKLSLLPVSIKFESIAIFSNLENETTPDSVGIVSSVRLKGINLFSAVFKKDVRIAAITISNSDLKANIVFPENEEKSPFVSDINIEIGKLFFENVNLAITDAATASSYSVVQGNLKIYDFQLLKLDTLAPTVIEQFNINAKELSLISTDSLYTYTVQGFSYSTFSNLLEINNLAIKPNYSDYEFTKRFEYETDRFDAVLSYIRIDDFSALDYMKSGNIKSSHIDIGSLNLVAFRDKREQFKHVNRPTFQELIYNYPAILRIDSIAIFDGKITYIEHAEEASEAGFITFDKFSATLQNVTNDTIYKTESAFLELRAKALLMGKGRLSVHLKSKVFDPQNTFTLEGSLTSMEVSALNPMLEKNAFVFVKSGTIDAMDFNFTADNTKASGDLIMRYHDLDFVLVDKVTNETTSINNRIKSYLADLMVLDSNPVSVNNVRIGIIDYERDPEKFLFNYSFKSIFSGMKSSLVRQKK
jgi:hypothetical protein